MGDPLAPSQSHQELTKSVSKSASCPSLLRREDGVDDDLVVVTGAGLDENQAVSGT